ncbi:MAG: type II secretion system F family protein [Deltaproteobacteria bacterium]|nr:MAG: type II secretion system F family protein [Deltaproteobacteria bacterium]
MNYFRYKLIEPSGAVSSGIIKLPYKEVTSVMAHLERDGSTAIYVKKLGPIGNALVQLGTFRLRKKLPRSFQAEFLGNLSFMLSSGMTLTTALEEAATSSDRPDFENDIKEIVFRIQGGSTFSEAASSYPHIFPQTVIHLIRIGEETGKLDRTLLDASEHLKRVDQIISDTKQALTYPSFVFVAMGAGMLFWFYYVVPKIVTLFQEMDVTLPTLTQWLLAISDFVRSNILTILAILALVVIFLYSSYKRSQKVRKAVDRLILRLPLSSSIANASSLAFVTEYFSLLLNVGIDLMQSMNILRESIRNEVYREKVEAVRSSISRGETIAGSFRKAEIFPSFVVRMIHVGEQSGTLPDQLERIAENYRNKLSVLVATIGKLIEPIVLVVAGGIFAIIVGGLFLPIYDLISKISG